MAKVLLIGESGDTVRYTQADVNGVPVVGSVDLDSGFTGPALVSEVCRAWEGPGGSKWWVPVSEPQAEVSAHPGASAGQECASAAPVPAEVPEVPGGAESTAGPMYSRRALRRIVAREVARARAACRADLEAARSAAVAEAAGVGGAVVGLAEGVQLVSAHTAGASARAGCWPMMAGAVAVGAGVCAFLGLSTIDLAWFGAGMALPVAGLVAGIIMEGWCRARSWAPVQESGGYKVRVGRDGAELWCRSAVGAVAWRPVAEFVAADLESAPLDLEAAIASAPAEDLPGLLRAVKAAQKAAAGAAAEGGG